MRAGARGGSRRHLHARCRRMAGAADVVLPSACPERHAAAGVARPRGLGRRHRRRDRQDRAANEGSDRGDREPALGVPRRPGSIRAHRALAGRGNSPRLSRCPAVPVRFRLCSVRARVRARMYERPSSCRDSGTDRPKAPFQAASPVPMAVPMVEISGTRAGQVLGEPTITRLPARGAQAPPRSTQSRPTRVFAPHAVHVQPRALPTSAPCARRRSACPCR